VSIKFQIECESKRSELTEFQCDVSGKSVLQPNLKLKNKEKMPIVAYDFYHTASLHYFIATLKIYRRENMQ